MNTSSASHTRIIFPDPPRGLKTIPWRLPILFYRLGLGCLLGRKFLLLTHTGRISGQPRQAVLEIIEAYPDQGRYLVVSGFGTRSDWYRNILSDSQVTIQVGSKQIKAFAKQLDPALAGEIMVDYAQKYPGNLKALSNLLGYKIEPTPAGYRSFGEQIPVIQFSSQIKPGANQS
jgi:deazaflavin-dependent oxidoreductase (nitroreductase family)